MITYDIPTTNIVEIGFHVSKLPLVERGGMAGSTSTPNPIFRGEMSKINFVPSDVNFTFLLDII